MMGDVSWCAYGCAVMVLLLVWYGWVFLRYFAKDFKSFFNKNLQGQFSASEDEKNRSPFASYKESFDTIQEAKQLYHKLVSACIESNDRGISKTEFKHYIKFILDEYPYVKRSLLREKIKGLLLAESQKYPGFELSKKEMDDLWEDEKQ